MTDEQIVKALECCIQIDTESCCSCPLYDREQGCLGGDIRKDALSLIKRQQAEIERLHEVINAFEEQSHKELMDYMQLSEKYENARAEAVREFAEKLTEHSSFCVAKSDGKELYETKAYTIRAKIIDELVREMTEGKK